METNKKLLQQKLIDHLSIQDLKLLLQLSQDTWFISDTLEAASKQQVYKY
jgi:hypothetical protein